MHRPGFSPSIRNLTDSARSNASSRPTEPPGTTSPPENRPSADPLAGSAPPRTAWGSADPEALLRRFWERMAGIYGNLWSSGYAANANSPAGQEWGRGLAMFTPAQIKAGIDICAERCQMPPTLPAFRELCLQLPPLPEVRRQLLARDGARAPFVTLVASRLDLYRWRQADQRDSDSMLREAYAEARTHALAGGELPQQLPAIAREAENAGPKPTAEQVAAAREEAMRLMREEIAEEAERSLGLGIV